MPAVPIEPKTTTTCLPPVCVSVIAVFPVRVSAGYRALLLHFRTSAFEVSGPEGCARSKAPAVLVQAARSTLANQVHHPNAVKSENGLAVSC